MPLEIKVGHRYRTRSGDVVEIVSNENIGTFPFFGRLAQAGAVLSFTDLGTWGTVSGSCFDLIEELPARCHICGDDTGTHTPDCTSFLPGIYHVAAP